MTSSPDLAIRMRRAAFNAALAAADLDAIGGFLHRDAILVTGTDSAILSGRRAQLLAWKREFGAIPRTTYLRAPDSIVASPVAPIALEQGRWQGTTPTGAPVASGVYSAKWRNMTGEWTIVAEIYVTLG